MSQLRLLVDALHALTARFKNHAVLKGGFELILFSSQRYTNDLDFVFVPFESKKDIVADVEACLVAIEGVSNVSVSLSSKNAKFVVNRPPFLAEVEISVATEVPSIPLNTVEIAKKLNLQPQIIRVMKPEVALAHKIAAWNERRLLRDLFDTYYWYSRQGILPDLAVLKLRLNSVQSKIPRLSRVKSMTMQQLCDELSNFIEKINQEMIDAELPSIPTSERRHLDKTMQISIKNLIAGLQQID